MEIKERENRKENNEINAHMCQATCFTRNLFTVEALKC